MKIARKTIKETEEEKKVLPRIHIPDYQEENGSSSVSDSESEFSSAVIAMNSSNSAKISFSRRVPLIEWRILLPSFRRASKSYSRISSITSILKQVMVQQVQNWKHVYASKREFGWGQFARKLYDEQLKKKGS
ncbi:hypothetical protein Tco_1563728 [Tanacetum coccineum]